VKQFALKIDELYIVRLPPKHVLHLLQSVAVCCSLLQSVAVVSFQRITEQLLLSMSEFVINV
jgi:hypothetical protein